MDAVTDEQMDTSAFIKAVVVGLPASEDRLTSFHQAQQNDSICLQFMTFGKNWWPSKYQLDPEQRLYWEHRGNLTVVSDLHLHGCCVVVPSVMREEILCKFHKGHLGIAKTKRERAPSFGGQRSPNR